MADSPSSMGVPQHGLTVSKAFGLCESSTERLASQAGTRGAWGCRGGLGLWLLLPSSRRTDEEAGTRNQSSSVCSVPPVLPYCRPAPRFAQQRINTLISTPQAARLRALSSADTSQTHPHGRSYCYTTSRAAQAGPLTPDGTGSWLRPAVPHRRLTAFLARPAAWCWALPRPPAPSSAAGPSAACRPPPLRRDNGVSELSPHGGTQELGQEPEDGRGGGGGGSHQVKPETRSTAWDALRRSTAPASRTCSRRPRAVPALRKARTAPHVPLTARFSKRSSLSPGVRDLPGNAPNHVPTDGGSAGAHTPAGSAAGRLLPGTARGRGGRRCQRRAAAPMGPNSSGPNSPSVKFPISKTAPDPTRSV